MGGQRSEGSTLRSQIRCVLYRAPTLTGVWLNSRPAGAVARAATAASTQILKAMKRGEGAPSNLPRFSDFDKGAFPRRG